MDPISNQIYAHDFQKFVLQDPNVINYYYCAMRRPNQPFSLDVKKSDKTKKDVKKQKSDKRELKKPFT